MDISPYNQPTPPWNEGDAKQLPLPAQVSGAAQPQTAPAAHSPRGLSRRHLFGAAIASVGVAAAGGAFAVEQLWQHGNLGGISLNSFLQGQAASSTQVGHLLRRAGFGASPDDLALYISLGFHGAVEQLINYQQASDDDMERRLQSLNLDMTKIQDVQRWWLLRMAWTQRPLLEKMTLFWHGVLTSSYRKAGGKSSAANMLKQNQFLRQHAFDTFDNILLGVTSDPAMLIYLDLTTSKKTAPNENYARELMELFTLGLGHYTQQDVYNAAAALTGWHIARGATPNDAYTSRYIARTHNDAVKQYLGHTGNLDYRDVINILTNHPATPSFICRKLFTFFVYENPSNDDIQPLVDTYVKSGHNMGEVMRTLLNLPQFSSSRAYRARVKSPTEFVAGAYRALKVQEQGNALQAPQKVTITGQALLDPPNVAGWPGDKISSLWLNSGTWLARMNYIDALLVGVRNRTSNNAYKGIDLQAVVDANHIDTPERFVDYYTAFLLDGVLDKDRRAQLIAYFTTPDTSKGGGQITLTGGKSYPLNRVRGTLYLLMASPEYQLN